MQRKHLDQGCTTRRLDPDGERVISDRRNKLKTTRNVFVKYGDFLKIETSLNY